MEDLISRLLTTELEAEALVADAKLKYDELVQRAQEEARAAEVALDLHVPELRSQRVDQEAARAVLVIAELKQRYDELHREQHARAEQRAGEALELAMAILLDAERA